MRLVLDSNTVVSALLWHGPPYQLFTRSRAFSLAFFSTPPCSPSSKKPWRIRSSPRPSPPPASRLHSCYSVTYVWLSSRPARSPLPCSLIPMMTTCSPVRSRLPRSPPARSTRVSGYTDTQHRRCPATPRGKEHRLIRASPRITQMQNDSANVNNSSLVPDTRTATISPVHSRTSKRSSR